MNETMDEYVVNAPDEGNVSTEVEPDPEENAGKRERQRTGYHMYMQQNSVSLYHISCYFLIYCDGFIK